MANHTTQKAQPVEQKISKKTISKTVYEKLASSLAEYDLHGKKFDHKLKKVSKLFADDIARATRKKEKAKTKNGAELHVN